eukprot:365990-Chlamydomonas_euryale.AAC.39
MDGASVRTPPVHALARIASSIAAVFCRLGSREQPSGESSSRFLLNWRAAYTPFRFGDAWSCALAHSSYWATSATSSPLRYAHVHTLRRAARPCSSLLS